MYQMRFETVSACLPGDIFPSCSATDAFKCLAIECRSEGGVEFQSISKALELL
jgi:hypothetical protein